MIKKIVKSLTSEVWNVGFVLNNLDGVLSGETLKVAWIKHSFKDSWFADPFILDVTDSEIQLLVEEYYKPINRGRISRLIIERSTMEVTKKDVVLELPTHLSFPAIIRRNGNIFIYPENGQSGELNIYQYIPQSNKCIKGQTILRKAIADAVLTQLNGKEYLFCTEQPVPNGNVLSVFMKNEEAKYVPTNKYVFDENVARMAGDFFEYLGKIYRPTQECNTQYGHAVTLQEVTLKDGELSFHEVRRLYSVHPRLNVGMHTFNMFKGLIVTDALGFHRVWIRKFLKILGILH